jgi:hypothetical protein
MANPKPAVKVAEWHDAAGFHVVDSLLDSPHLILAQSKRGKGLTHHFVGRRKAASGKMPLNLIPNIGR